MNVLKTAIYAALFGAAAAIAQTPPINPPTDPVEPQQQPTDPQQRTMDMPEFRTLDINGDGTLSKDEARASSTVTKHFDELDTDKNGMLTREEYAKAKLINKDPSRQPPSPTP